MYIKKTTGYVITLQKIAFSPNEKVANNPCRIVKCGRVLTLKEEAQSYHHKNVGVNSITNQGLRYYQVTCNPGACKTCENHNGAIYPVMQGKEGENLPPFHPNCKCEIQGFDTKNPRYDPGHGEVVVWLDIMYGDGTIEQKAQKLLDFYHLTEFSVESIASMLSAIENITHIGKRMDEFFSRLDRTPFSEINVPTHISNQGLNLLKLLEGFIGGSYSGVDSWNQTIGYGHVIQPEENFINGITEEDATELLAKDLQRFHVALHNFILENSLDLSQNQFDALLIFSYQLGPNIWDRDDYDFIQLLKSGIWTDEQITYEMGRFDVSGSAAYEGIWKRRMNEALLFVTGEYRLYEIPELEEIGYTWPKKQGIS